MQDPLAAQFVELVRRELERQGISVSELARMVGVPQQNASRLLNDERPITTATIVRYLEALGISPRLEADLGAPIS